MRRGIIQQIAKTLFETKRASDEERKAEKSAAIWSMRATIAIAIFTLISVAVGAFQFFALKEANRDNREAFTAVQRAFLFVETTQWQPIIDQASGNVTSWRALPVWHNSGNTPTRNLNIRLYCSAQYVNGKAASHMDQISIKILLGPQQKNFGGGCDFPLDLMKLIRSKGVRMKISSEAHYQDVFGGRHLTEYCSEIGDIGGDLDRGSDLSKIVVMTSQCSSHNCADEECPTNDR